MSKKVYCELTDSQMGVYLECMDNPMDLKYNIILDWDFPIDKIDSKRLAEAYYKVIKNYSAFHTSIIEKNGSPFMTNIDGEREIDYFEMKEKDFNNFVESFTTPFLFNGDYLYHTAFVKTESKLHFLLNIHHIIFDGTSLTVFSYALKNAYYNEELESEQGTLYTQAKLEKENENTKELKECYDFYEKYLEDLESDSRFIPDKNQAEEDRNKTVIEKITEFSCDEVIDFSKKIGVNENTLFMGAFAYTLSKFTMQNDVVFSSVDNGRFNREDLNNSVGMFVRTLPVRIKIDEESTVKDYLMGVKKSFVSSLAHDRASFITLANKYGVSSSVTYAYQGKILTEPSFENIPYKINLIESKHVIGDFSLMIFKVKDKYRLNCIFRNTMFSNAQIESILDTICNLVQEFLYKEKVCELKLIKDERVLDEFNKTEKEYDTSLNIVEKLEKNFKNYKDKLAVCYKDEKYTYRDYEIISKKIAKYVIDKKIGKNDFVAILMDRKPYFIFAKTGVLLAGAGYEPLDSAYPKDRLNFMVKDANVKLVICDRDKRSLLDEYNGDILYTDEIDSLEEKSFDKIKISPNDNFVILYTSGTTGMPKGCLISHECVLNFTNQHIAKINLDSNSKSAQYASFGFDASVMDIYSALCAGATLYIVPDDMRLDLIRVEKYFIDNKITHGFMTTQVGCMFLSQTKCKTLKVFGFGGEKIIPITPPTWVKTFNFYGPTEATVYVTSYVVKDNSSIQPIGKANDNIKLYIVDKFNRRVPLYCCGELCVAGRQVAKGYLNREDKTKEVFVKNIYDSDANYERIYKTGDIVRYLGSGDVDYIGRRDGQVKVRGFRIELSEVEQVIRSYKGINNVTVQAFDDASGGKFICAYITSENKIDIEDLNAFIAEQKPAYMVPAVTMQIDKIPVNVNGKVDKKNLPKPQLKLEKIIPPTTETEKKLFNIVSKIIGTTEFGVNTDLFTVGLSSISSIKLNVEIDETFNVPVQMKELKKLNNVANLAKFIDSNKQERVESKQEVFDDYPLTKTQEGIYIECVSNPNSTIYNVPILLKIDKEINLAKLKSAIVQAVTCHNYVNVKLFTNNDGVIRQKRPTFGSFCRDDIEEISANIDSIKDSLVKPFNLLNSRLFRIAIIKGENNYLFMDFHHIICDGTSYAILIRDIERAYNGENIENERFTALDKCIDEVKQRNSTFFNEAEDYYTKLLDGLDTDFLPPATLHGKAKNGSGQLNYEGKKINLSNLEKFLTKNSISANAFFNSAFGYVLSLYNGSEYSIFTTVYNGRNDSRLNNTISMLVKTLPVVSKVESNILEYINKMSKQLLDSMTYDVYSFAEISHNFNVKSDVMFIFQGDSFNFDTFCGKKSVKIALSLSKEKAPLVVQAFIENGAVKFSAEYDADRYNDEFVLEFIKTLERVINEFSIKQNIGEVSLVDSDELALINKFNNTEMPYDDSKNVVDLFDDCVKNYPNNIAVYYEDKTYTYLEFDKLTNKLANYIVERGIKKDEFVSILVNRDEYMAITSWAVVKAGAGYQPLDPTYPKDRLNFMVKDSKAKLLIADRSLRDLLSEYTGDVIYTDEIEGLTTSENKVNRKISPNDALIIIYTSGTTGLPKGCVLEHKNIVCFFYNHKKIIGLDNNSRVAQYASFGFDAGVMDIFTTLMCGATLYIIPDSIRLDISLMDKYYIENKITHGFMTTQVGRMFAMQTKSKSLKVILMGGEKLVPFVPQNGLRAINGYGPSETIAYVTHYELVDDGKVQPIGIAHNNTKLYIVDKNINLLPIGACGELCISGNQVGRGYFCREEKTNEVFIKNPFDNKKGYERIYRTGDVVRLLPDGNYDFVGRRDGQVKIRGFRVELTEVEQVIRAFDGIENATVQAFNDANGGKYLVAYIVSKESIDVDKLNSYILANKPPYMVPAVTMQIDKIPLNVNSKVDKRKLPVPTRKERVGLEPANGTEKSICEIFKSVLNQQKIYADDNFFEIGGTSILALQLVIKLENAGYNIVYKNIFDNPTPKQLASFIAGDIKKQNYFATDTNGKTKHNYSPLEYNIVDNVDKITSHDIGDVLLTGATGFLGSHVFIDLLDNTKGKIICIIRDKKGFTALDRLATILEFYFERVLTKEELERIVVVSGDLSDSTIEERLKGYHIDTILNCAANVKHFGSEESLMKDNATTVEVLINIAKSHDAVLVHASSISVSGESIDGNISKDFLFAENNLNIGQLLENLYARSKYLAEEKIIDEISNGLKAKIVRFGNLMGRAPDGEFQINAEGSGFLRLLKGYAVLGCFPVEQLDDAIEFSPIDCSARAMILLAGTPKEFTCFHANNCHSIHFANIIEALNKIGIKVDIVKRDEFNRRYKEVLEGNGKKGDFSGLLAYQNNVGKDGKVVERFNVPQTNRYTTKALYRLGFSWPIPDLKYLELLLELQKESGFFDI